MISILVVLTILFADAFLTTLLGHFIEAGKGKGVRG